MKKPRRRTRTDSVQRFATKWDISDVFELFGDESLYSILLRLEDEEHVSREEFNRALRASAAQRIRPALLREIRRRLKSQSRHPRGRPERDIYFEALLLLARVRYPRYLAWLRARETRPYGLTGWSCIRQATWWDGKPGERAARMVTRRLFRRQNIDWPHVRNLVSSRR